MGSLRFILALSVFLSHTGTTLFGLKLVGFSVAVQSFFLISGFYMALVLNEKYRGPGSYYLFVTNRLLRLMPAYWVVLVLTVVMIYALRPLFSEEPSVSYNFSLFFPLLDIKTQALIVVANVVVVGQDLVRLFGLDPQSGVLVLTRDPSTGAAGLAPVHGFFFIPPAWSIGAELSFYLVAPFLVRGRRLVILAIVAMSLLLRVLMFRAGYTETIWQFQFFPTELALFLSGALSYRLYAARKGFFSARVGLVCAVVLIGATLAYQAAPEFAVHGANMKKWAYYALLFLLIPGAFAGTSGSRADKYLGDLSYPVYIVHYSVIWLWVMVREMVPEAADINVINLALLALTLALSVALVHLVIEPIEKFRQARVKRAPGG